MRVSPMAAQTALANAITNNLRTANTLQIQMTTGKVSNNYADLNADAGTIVTSRAMVKREEAYSKSANKVASSLSLYETHIGSMYDRLDSLKQLMLKGVGTKDMAGMQAEMELLFSQLRASLNARDGDGYLFSSENADEAPFQINSLEELYALADPDVLTASGPPKQVRLGDERIMSFGFGAKELATDILSVLHGLGTLDLSKQQMSEADIAVVTAQIAKVDAGRAALSSARAENGRRQAEIERLSEQSLARVNVLNQIVSDGEDVNLADVSTKLISTQAALEASYAVFGAFSKLSLANYL